MKIGLFTAMFQDMTLEQIAQYAAGLGYEALEIPVFKGSPHLDMDKILKGETKEVRRILSRYNLQISALSNGRAGQMVLGPLDAATDLWAPSPDPQEKVRYGIEAMKNTARAAAELGVPVVTGFVGSNVWDKWYIFPPANEKMYEEGWKTFTERWSEILDVYRECGVKFAAEVHPNEICYNLETAEQALQKLKDYPEFGFNFDPSHLVWQQIDPVIFIKRLGHRIYHVHAKDGEIQTDEVGRSGLIPNGPWSRIDRGFRFRIPGWGDLNWRKIISALAQVGYDYVLSYEHEDAVMSREDGCEKSIAFLKPLIIKKPLEHVWW